MSEDDELVRAHERIRFLSRQLLKEDPLVQIAELKKKIALSKERAHEIVNMAFRRIDELTELCKEPSGKWTSKVETASNSSVSTDEEKVSDLKCSNYNVALSRAITILENISLSKVQFGSSKNEAVRIAKDLRNFLAKLQNIDQQISKSAEKPVSTACAIAMTTTTMSSSVGDASTANSTSLSCGTGNRGSSENRTTSDPSAAKSTAPSTASVITTASHPTPAQKMAEQAQNVEMKAENDQAEQKTQNDQSQSTNKA